MHAICRQFYLGNLICKRTCFFTLALLAGSIDIKSLNINKLMGNQWLRFIVESAAAAFTNVPKQNWWILYSAIKTWSLTETPPALYRQGALNFFRSRRVVERPRSRISLLIHTLKIILKHFNHSSITLSLACEQLFEWQWPTAWQKNFLASVLTIVCRTRRIDTSTGAKPRILPQRTQQH